ncbi:MAG: retention module-containing protein, partial [Janthinobacterium lividum]
MATAPTTAKSVASGTRAGGIGTVKTIVGTVTATDASGVQRTLQVGDVVHANDVIMTSAAGAVLVEFTDGSHVDLGRSSQIALDDTIFNPATAVSQQASVESIQAQIAAGADPTQVTDATAAGPGPAGNEGHTFVSVAQDAAQGQVTSGFDTTGISSTLIQTDNTQPLRVFVDPTIETVVPTGGPDVNGNTVPEGIPLVYNVGLSATTAAPVTYAFALGGGTASPADYVAPVFSNGVVYDAANGTVTVPAGVSSFTVTVGTVVDTIYEGSESLPLTVGGVTGTGFITDTNVPTVVTVEPGAPGVAGDSVPEGTPLVYNVSLSNPSATATTFTFALGGPAGVGLASPADYTTPPTFSNGVTYDAVAHTVTVPAGVTSFAVTVGTVVDSLYEISESLPLTVGGVTGTGFITDTNAPAVVSVSPSVDGNTVPEGTNLVYNVTLSNPSTTPSTFAFTLGGGTGVGAATPDDYTTPSFDHGVTYNASNGTITVPAGVTSFAVTVGTVIDDVYENRESLPLTVGGVTGTGFITDTNVPTIVTVEPGAPGVAGDSVPEGTPLVYNVTMSNPSTTATTFAFALGGGTASANDYTTPPTFDHGVTYNATTGMITVPAGVTNFAVTVGTVIDNVYENSET